jgi:hypothetical protein
LWSEPEWPAALAFAQCCSRLVKLPHEARHIGAIGLKEEEEARTEHGAQSTKAGRET